MGFFDNIKINKNKIREDKVTLQTVTSLFVYFLLALFYYIRKNTNYKFILGIMVLILIKDLYKYFSNSNKDSIDGMDVPNGESNYNLTI